MDFIYSVLLVFINIALISCVCHFIVTYCCSQESQEKHFKKRVLTEVCTNCFIQVYNFCYNFFHFETLHSKHLILLQGLNTTEVYTSHCDSNN